MAERAGHRHRAGARRDQKKYTNVFCPSEIRRYRGDTAYAKLCAPFPADDRPARRSGCFPAGHASGGFALLGLLLVRAGGRLTTRKMTGPPPRGICVTFLERRIVDAATARHKLSRKSLNDSAEPVS